MILNKLREALAEVDAERTALAGQLKALEEVESQLRIMIAKLSGTVVQTSATKTVPVSASDAQDKIDQVIEVLRAEGAPLHINRIAERLTALTGTAQSRLQIEPGLNRHISKAKKRRLDKFGPSTFGLAEWKSETKSLLDNITPGRSLAS